MSWKAQYEQFDAWHDMNFLSLEVNENPGGIVKGHGSDEVGEFTFEGSFSQADPVVRILKQYKGKHAIYYEGRRTSPGEINGDWGFEPGEKDGKFRMKKF